MGKTWVSVTAGLPAGVYVHVVKEDPKRRGLLFAGTERAAWISFDDGDHWQPLQLNLPVTSVRDFEIHGNDLIVATHGRGFWVIDDISPLRQLTGEIARSNAYLFKPDDAINAVQGGDNGTPLQKDEPQTPSRFNGAFIDYYLKSTPANPVRLEITDASGATVASVSSDGGTIPTPAARGGGGGGGRGGGGRGGRGGGIPNISPLWEGQPELFSAAPGFHRVPWNPGGGGGRGGGTPVTGKFTVKLTVDGQVLSQPLTINPDPRLK